MLHICGIVLLLRQWCLLAQEYRTQTLQSDEVQSLHHLWKGSKILHFLTLDTRHSLCSELWGKATIAAEQDNGVGKRGRRPGRVTRSLHTVIVSVSSDRRSYSVSVLLYIHRHFLRFGAFLIHSMSVRPSVFFVVLRVFFVSFCQSVPPEFLQSFFKMIDVRA